MDFFSWNYFTGHFITIKLHVFDLVLQFLMTLMEELHTALLQPNSNQELFSIDQKLNQILKSINLVFIKLIKNKNTDNNLMEFIDDFSKKCPVMLGGVYVFCQFIFFLDQMFL